MISVEKLAEGSKTNNPTFTQVCPKIYAGGISIFAISVRDC